MPPSVSAPFPLQPSQAELQALLDLKYEQFNQSTFIQEDPIAIPHAFQKREDIEISGFFSALIAWGRRDIIVRNARALMDRMDRAPHAFVMQAQAGELQPLANFVHRTFQEIDAKALVLALRQLYQTHGSLEAACCDAAAQADDTTFTAIMNLRAALVCAPNFPPRTHKHLANPSRGSSAKRLNMFLRWMVRRDGRGVDFGLWSGLKPHQLICPLDVHTAKVGRKLGLLRRKQNDWKAAVELTQHLRRFAPEDPVKYDFSLFGLGVMEGF